MNWIRIVVRKKRKHTNSICMCSRFAPQHSSDFSLIYKAYYTTNYNFLQHHFEKTLFRPAFLCILSASWLEYLFLLIFKKSQNWELTFFRKISCNRSFKVRFFSSLAKNVCILYNITIFHAQSLRVDVKVLQIEPPSTQRWGLSQLLSHFPIFSVQYIDKSLYPRVLNTLPNQSQAPAVLYPNLSPM